MKENIKVKEKKKINVLFMVDKSGFGGVQTIAYNLMDKEIGKNINMYYFFLRDINDRFGMKKVNKENVFYSKTRGRYSLKSFLELRRIIKEKQIDVLHANGNKSIILSVYLKKIYFPNIKIIAHEHGGVFDYKRWYFKFLNSNQKTIDLFISLSNQRKNQIIKESKINKDKIVVIYNFVDLDKFNRKNIKINIKKEKEKLGIKKDQFVIGYMGGLSRIKGVDILINAVKLLCKEEKNFKVIIAGDGPEKENLMRLSKSLGLEKKIIFLGYAKNPIDVYPLFDVLVIPSRSEAFGIVALETMALKIPVIASYVEGLREIIEDGKNGLLFKDKNTKKLNQKIVLLKENKKIREKIILKGINKSEKYSIKNYLKELERVYKNPLINT